MTYATAVRTVDPHRIRPLVRPAAAAVLVASAPLTVHGAHSWAEVAVVEAVIVALLVGVYHFLLPSKLTALESGTSSATRSKP